MSWTTNNFQNRPFSPVYTFRGPAYGNLQKNTYNNNNRNFGELYKQEEKEYKDNSQFYGEGNIRPPRFDSNFNENKKNLMSLVSDKNFVRDRLFRNSYGGNENNSQLNLSFGVSNLPRYGRNQLSYGNNMSYGNNSGWIPPSPPMRNKDYRRLGFGGNPQVIESDKPNDRFYEAWEDRFQKAGLPIPKRDKIKEMFWGKGSGPQNRAFNSFRKQIEYRRNLQQEEIANRRELNEQKQKNLIEQQEERSAELQEKKLHKAYIDFIEKLLTNTFMTYEEAKEKADEVFGKKKKNTGINY